MGDPRVSGRQLLSPNGKENETDKDADEEKDSQDELDEFSSAGAIAGFTGPLGASSEDLKGPGAGPKQKKKRITGWEQ